jgi:hypothetical protein
MSSPQMTRMFGFFPKDGEGDCALAMPAAVKMQATARMSVCTISFVLIGFGFVGFCYYWLVSSLAK